MQKAWGQAATSTVQFAQARNTIQKYFQAQVLKFCHYTFFGVISGLLLFFFFLLLLPPFLVVVRPYHFSLLVQKDVNSVAG